MKLCLAILLTSFISIEAHGSRVKRGLSADEQKKFLEELNKDRKRVAKEAGFEFVPMMPLRLNDGAEKMRKYYMSTFEGNIYSAYFNANFDKIGCSKEAKCTEVLINKVNDGPSELEGTTIEYYGMCALGNREYGINYDPDRLKKAEAPSPNKYADILGISGGNQGSGIDGTDGAGGEQGSGAGSVFSLTISLFLVLYI